MLLFKMFCVFLVHSLIIFRYRSLSTREAKEINLVHANIARGPPSAGRPPGLTCMVMSKGVAASSSSQGWNMALEASTKKMRLSRPENL